MSTYTPSLGLEAITPGDQAGLWGNTTNNNLALIDQAVTGVTPISFTGLSGTTYTLTDFDGAVDEARSAVLNITGIATGSNNVVVPNKQKTYLVRNSTGQNVVFRTASPTATYTVEAGNSILIFCDGNNNVFTGIASPSVGTLGVAGGGTGQTTFGGGGFVKSSGGTNALTASAAVSLASEVTGTLPVSNGGTGLSTLTAGAILRGAGSSAPALVSGPAGVPGQVLTWNGSQWEGQNPASAGVSSISAGSGISVNQSTGAVTVTNSGVTSLTAGTGISVSGSSGGVTVTNTGPTLSSNNTFSGSNTFTGGITSTAYNFAGTTSIAYNGSTTVQISIGGSNAGTFTTAAASFPGNVYSNNQTSGLQNNAVVVGNTTSGMYNSGSAIGFQLNNNFLGDFSSGGNLTIAGATAIKASGTTWSNPSDVRLKDNIQNYTDGLNKIMQVQPKTWSYNGKGGTKAGTKGLGVIADEIQQVLPNTVGVYKEKLNPEDADKTDIKNFDATEITWLLVNSVKELKAELDAAKAEIAALKAK